MAACSSITTTSCFAAPQNMTLYPTLSPSLDSWGKRDTVSQSSTKTANGRYLIITASQNMTYEKNLTFMNPFYHDIFFCLGLRFTYVSFFHPPCTNLNRSMHLKDFLFAIFHSTKMQDKKIKLCETASVILERKINVRLSPIILIPISLY